MIRFEFQDEPWHTVSRVEMYATLAFLGGVWLMFFTGVQIVNLINNLNLIFHEGGHMLFQHFGRTLGVMGGTLLQLIVPAAIALHFAIQRQLSGVAFGMFLFFQNFLNIAIYIADARAQNLDLVSTGPADGIIEHDWIIMLGWFNAIHLDTKIGAVVKFLGYVGMLAVLAWFFWRSRQTQKEAEEWADAAGA